jgi:hypothetical protein
MNSNKTKVALITLTALIFPGLGHLCLKKWIRALLLCASILLLFVLGIKLEGRLYEWDLSQPIMLLPFFADLSVGIPYWLAKSWGFGAGNMQNQSYDYGTTYLIVAGLLNWLVVHNAYDIAEGRKK